MLADMHNASELKQDALRFIAQYSNGVILVSFFLYIFLFCQNDFPLICFDQKNCLMRKLSFNKNF